MYPEHDNGEGLDDKIEQVKKRSRESFRETMILAEKAPPETVNGTIPLADKHLARMRKKTSDIRGDTRELGKVDSESVDKKEVEQ